MKFIVDRRTWYRGQGSATSALLRGDGARCCIGFVGAQCGVDDELMRFADAAWNAPSTAWPAWILRVRDVRACYEINDDPTIADAEREKLLAETFALHGDEIEFVG
jgi:hypothetical protein